MNLKNTKSRAFLESLLMIGLGTLYILVGVNFAPIINILFPVFFIVLGIRNGIEYNIVSIIISTLLAGIFTDKLTGLFIIISFMPLSIVLNYMIEKRKKSNEVILYTTITALISFVVAITLMGKLADTSFINQIEESFGLILKSQLDMLKEMGLTSSEIYQTKDILENMYEYMVLIIPSIIIIFSLIAAYLNFGISVFVLRKLGYGIVYTPKISYFKLPSNIILGIIIIYLGVYLLKILKIFYYETILINVSVLTSFVFFLQGLAVIVFFLNKSKWHPAIKIIFIIFLLISIPLSAIISLFGFLDVIFDFRQLKKGI